MNLAPTKSSLGRRKDEPASPRKARVSQEAEESKVEGALFPHACGNVTAVQPLRKRNEPANDREPNNKRSGSASLESMKPKAESPRAHEPTESNRLLSGESSGLTRKAGNSLKVQLSMTEMDCPKCGHKISDKTIARSFASIGGSKTSRAKKAAAIANGKLGGPKTWRKRKNA